MRNRIVVYLILAVIMVVAASSKTADAQVHIGTVDLEKIRSEAPRFKEAIKEIDDMVADFEQLRDRKQTELESLAEDLESASRLGGATFERQRQEMVEKSGAYQQFMEETFGNEGVIETRSSELLAPLYADLAEAGEKVAEAKGLDLILDLEQINPLFSSENLDVTEAVLAEFLKMR
jgi:Skp family chaperone for outer membrane proteins